MKTVKLYNLGCKVNQYDLQLMREQFIGAGFKELENGAPADIYLINTCTVTHGADSDSLGFIYRAHRENPQALIIVSGCLAESGKDKLSRIEGVNLIIGNKEKEDIIKYLPKGFRPAKKEKAAGLAIKGISYFKGHTRAFLKIQDGCNNFCSYCKIPYVRGRSRSKPLSEIRQEAARLVKNGFKEIVLCGVCLGAYGRDILPKTDLVKVIENLENIDGLLRLRLSSIEPRDVSISLINKLRVSSKLCPQLHIPLQSGDNEILKKMKRNYTKEFYLKLVTRLRRAVPRVAISTDVLVGFPAETDKQFTNSLAVIKAVLPFKTHIFRYSNREGTHAARNFKNVLTPGVLKKRMAMLSKVAEESSLIYKKYFLGKEADALMESFSKQKIGYQEGHTDRHIKVLVKDKDILKNKLIRVKLVKLDKGVAIAKRLITK